LLKHPTLDQLHTLGLHGMAKAGRRAQPSGMAESSARSRGLPAPGQATGRTAARREIAPAGLVLYQRVPRLFEELALARGDGRHARVLRSLGRADLLVLDDWGLEPLNAAARHDLLEILEERYGRKSTLVTSQLPVDRWHEIIGDPTYADAIPSRPQRPPHLERVRLFSIQAGFPNGRKNAILFS
jgi:hypothetical protein